MNYNTVNKLLDYNKNISANLIISIGNEWILDEITNDEYNKFCAKYNYVLSHILLKCRKTDVNIQPNFTHWFDENKMIFEALTSSDEIEIVKRRFNFKYLFGLTFIGIITTYSYIYFKYKHT